MQRTEEEWREAYRKMHRRAQRAERWFIRLQKKHKRETRFMRHLFERNKELAEKLKRRVKFRRSK